VTPLHAVVSICMTQAATCMGTKQSAASPSCSHLTPACLANYLSAYLSTPAVQCSTGCCTSSPQ
jgi:hypothetical protein